MIKRVKLLPATLASCMDVNLCHSCSSKICFPAGSLGRQQRMGHLLEYLPTTWKTWVMLLAPSFILAHHWLLHSFREWTSSWFPLLSFSLFLCGRSPADLCLLTGGCDSHLTCPWPEALLLALQNVTSDITGGSRGIDVPSGQLQCYCWVGGLWEDTSSPPLP